MHADHGFWQERVGYEDSAYWRYEDAKGTARVKRGSGSLGSCVGSSMLEANGLDVPPVHPGLFKTQSMPLLAVRGPCGVRIGGDSGMSDIGDDDIKPKVALVHRFSDDVESRIHYLERNMMPVRRDSVTACSMIATPGGSSWGGSRPSVSRGSRVPSRGGLNSRSGKKHGDPLAAATIQTLGMPWTYPKRPPHGCWMQTLNIGPT
eukprot:gnl/TRDRNA2_/TRDRNA2_61037_c0_seq1.p1 gnl/TRDRNA2_/TRDRNA2_61037_c0~~gnl/TRDRNA2_/TRDRNA2_61037_c0_seq1.p1  ORF type:complete len:214 (+),score=20.71 gnl/TRDRNA2_/TRDRNA2_61037_c0_seq1:29-643(+)